MKITIADIHAKNPCYDPTKYLPENWSGTLCDILRVDAAPAADRIWCVTQFLDDRTNRLFAVWCARESLKIVTNPDSRSVAACDVAERFANGEATAEELVAARDAAYAADAYAAAAYAAARDAAYAAARDAAYAAYAADAAYAAEAAYAAKAKMQVCILNYGLALLKNLKEEVSA